MNGGLCGNESHNLLQHLRQKQPPVSQHFKKSYTNTETNLKTNLCDRLHKMHVCIVHVINLFK